MSNEDERRILSGGELAIIIGLVLPIFFFLGGPIWEHAFRIDSAILWSYLPIPVLVSLALVRRKAFSFAGFLVSTTMALSIKYMITASVAIVLWSIGAPPPPDQKQALAPHAAHPKTPPSTTPPIPITLEDGGFSPSLAVVHRGQPVIFRATDRSLHTVRGRTTEGGIAFHYPIVPGRDSNPVHFDRSTRIELSCAVHEQERHGALIIVE